MDYTQILQSLLNNISTEFLVSDSAVSIGGGGHQIALVQRQSRRSGG
ncbi:hypothetical protein [Marinobacter nauticus]|nr:hypothetical protein [Marinobacter nauticus]